MKIESKFICAIPNLETTQISFGELMVRQSMVCLDSETVFSNKIALTITIQTVLQENYDDCKRLISKGDTASFHSCSTHEIAKQHC